MPPTRPKALPCWLLALLALACSGCTTLDQELHLAPAFSTLSRAGGGIETEAVFGALRLRSASHFGRIEQWAARPIVIHEPLFEERANTYFLTPLGLRRKDGGDLIIRLLPISQFTSYTDEADNTQWQLISLPGLFWAKFPDGRIVRAWFPVGGVVEQFFTFDRIDFVLWPLFMRTVKNGRTTFHFLFPIFSYTLGDDTTSHRYWPLYGRSNKHGSWDRRFALWPFLHYHQNRLSEDPEKRELKWAVWPLFGYTGRGAYHSYSALWPFLGFSHNPETGYWALDFPWFFVRILRDPENDVERTRLWPLWSYYSGNGLESEHYLWPIYNQRREEYHDGVRTTVRVVPFWQHLRRTYDDDDQGQRDDRTYQKLWPVYQRDSMDGPHKFAFPALNPFWRTPVFDEMYAWIWELYTHELDEDKVRRRALWGIYKREKDADEERTVITGLWGRRKWWSAGEPMTDTSILFGLLRWRMSRRGFEGFLRPALPGPGWPLERTPRTSR